MSYLSCAPSILNVPISAIPVDDVDEEIFLLYTRKLGLAETDSDPTSSSERATASTAKTSSPGLGFLDTTKEVIIVPLLIEPSTIPTSSNNISTGFSKSNKGRASLKKKAGGSSSLLPKELEVMVCQDFQALRHRRGDTGSVLWRISIHLAHHFLSDHFFPSPIHSPLFHDLSHLRVLELGSGTGFLGSALAPFFHHWTFTDQFESLALIQRTLVKNQGNNPALKDPKRVDVQELDWVEEGNSLSSNSTKSSDDSDRQEDQEPDLIIASDCIYNPSLSEPLARTIAKRAIKGKTVVLIASELRDQDALEIFLAKWIELGFEVNRLVINQSSIGHGLGGNEFVVWIGWKA